MLSIHESKSIGLNIQLIILGSSVYGIFSEMGLTSEMATELTHKIVVGYKNDYEKTYTKLQTESDLQQIRQALEEKNQT